MLFTSCDNDGDTITVGSLSDITLYSSGDVVLSKATPGALALTLYWNDNSKLNTNNTKVLAPSDAVTNTIEYSSTENFETIVSEVLDAQQTSKQFTTQGLNALVGRLGFEGGVSSSLYVRIKSVLANNMPVQYSKPLMVNITPYVIDMTRGILLNSNMEETGQLLASPLSDGVYSGFIGALGWTNFFLEEGNGIVWGNDGISGTPFVASKEDSKWNMWYPGQSGCYYTTVNTVKYEWTALYIPSLKVSGDIEGDMEYIRTENKWILKFNADHVGKVNIRITGNGNQYDKSTGTDDSKATVTPVAFSQNDGKLSFGSEPTDITVDLPAAGSSTLELNLSNPFAFTCTVVHGGTAPVAISKYLYMSGVDDGLSGKWTFDNFLLLYNEDEQNYAGLCNVNSLWGYMFYPTKDDWENKYSLSSGDAQSGTLVKGGTNNIPAPTPGLYLITASLKYLSYHTMAVSSVQIAGVNDRWDLLDMQATGVPGVYTATLDITAESPWGFKIYLNKSWDYYFGDSDGSLIYMGKGISYDKSLIGNKCIITVNLCKGTYTIAKANN